MLMTRVSLADCRGADEEAEALLDRSSEVRRRDRAARRRLRTAWLATRYSPVLAASVVVLAGRFVNDLVAGALVVVVPVLVVVAAPRLLGVDSASVARSRGAIALATAASVVTAVGGALWLPFLAAVPLLLSRWLVIDEEDVDPATLPDPARAVLARVPGCRVVVHDAISSTFGFAGAALPNRTVVISEGALAGEPETLAQVLAHEVAHHQDGFVLAIVGDLGVPLVAWVTGAAVAMRIGAGAWFGPASGSLGRHLVWTSLVIAVASIAFEPLGLWLSRRREARVEELALTLLDDPTRALMLLRYAHGTGRRSRLATFLMSSHPDRETYHRIAANYRSARSTHRQ
jgi:Zn-dependent protease with chaperone function